MSTKTKPAATEPEAATVVPSPFVAKTMFAGLIHADSVQDASDLLAAIRKFIYAELKDGTDFGRISGCGDKPTLFLPGAQKLALFLNCYPDYEIQRLQCQGEHVEYTVKTTMVSRVTDAKVGSGVGSCSTLEKKYRWQTASRCCPKCQQPSIRTSKVGGFFCGVRSGGCGASFPANDRSILEQKLGKVDADDLADKYNTVLKMAKKRSFVDGVLSLACVSEFFTQDLEDTRPPAADDRHDDEPPARPQAEPEHEPAAEWVNDSRVANYNREFELLVDVTGLRGTEKEPAARSFFKAHWVKFTKAANVEARPDRIPSDIFPALLLEWTTACIQYVETQREQAAATAEAAKPKLNPGADQEAQYHVLRKHLLTQLGGECEKNVATLLDGWRKACRVAGSDESFPPRMTAESFQQAMETWQADMSPDVADQNAGAKPAAKAKQGRKAA